MITRIEDETLNILGFFNEKERAKLRPVCKNWKAIIDDYDKTVLKALTTYRNELLSTRKQIHEINFLKSRSDKELLDLSQTYEFAKVIWQTPALKNRIPDQKALLERAECAPNIQVKKRKPNARCNII